MRRSLERDLQVNYFVAIHIRRDNSIDVVDFACAPEKLLALTNLNA